MPGTVQTDDTSARMFASCINTPQGTHIARGSQFAHCRCMLRYPFFILIWYWQNIMILIF